MRFPCAQWIRKGTHSWITCSRQDYGRAATKIHVQLRFFPQLQFSASDKTLNVHSLLGFILVCVSVCVCACVPVCVCVCVCVIVNCISFYFCYWTFLVVLIVNFFNLLGAGYYIIIGGEMLLKIIPPVTVILIMDLLRYQYFPPPSSNSNRTVCLIFRNSTHTHKDLGTHSPYSKTSSTSIIYIMW